MIVLNGVVGLCLLLGGLRHHEQAYNLPGALAYLAVIIPLSVIALVLPNLAGGPRRQSYVRAGGFLLVVYRSSLRHFPRDPDCRGYCYFFIETDPNTEGAIAAQKYLRRCSWGGAMGCNMLLLVVTVLPIVLPVKQLAKLIDHWIAVLEAPAGLGGVLIAVIVFMLEAISALRAALDNELQRSINLCSRSLRVHHWSHGARDTRHRDRDRHANGPGS